MRHESKLEEQRREKARVSALLNRARSSAGTIKLVLPRDHPCPYCGGPLGVSPHADHIHPVAKGGLSTLQNMVYICASCNSKKTHHTLTAFAAKEGKNLDQILARLRALGKEF
jgi:5-methylcytosine-specific restriction endonuclease McrA